MGNLELRRDRDQAMAGGVCAGIASRFDYDVTLVRVVTVLLAFAGGFGVIAYLALWLLLPARDETTGSATAVARANVEEMAGVARRAATEIGGAARSAARSARTTIGRDSDERDGPAAADTSGMTATEKAPRGATPRRTLRTQGRTRPSAVPFTPSAVQLPPGGTASPSSGRGFMS